MPDDHSFPSGNGLNTALRDMVPPALMALGAISLFRTSRVLTLALLGTWAYDTVARADHDRIRRHRNIAARRKREKQIDQAIEDSFPASDPPSSHGATAGAP